MNNYLKSGGLPDAIDDFKAFPNSMKKYPTNAINVGILPQEDSWSPLEPHCLNLLELERRNTQVTENTLNDLARSSFWDFDIQQPVKRSRTDYIVTEDFGIPEFENTFCSPSNEKDDDVDLPDLENLHIGLREQSTDELKEQEVI